MKIEEYMVKYKLSYKQVYDRIQKGELPAVKHGKQWNITLDTPPVLPQKANGNLKDALTAVQIKKIQQQLAEGKRSIEENYMHETIEAVMIVLKDIKDCIDDLKLDNKQKKRLLELKKDERKVITPIRLQAYERSTLFLERISPEALIPRVHKNGMSARQLQQEMLNDVRREFDHNLSQQMYMSDQVWMVIKKAKEETHIHHDR